MEAEITRKRTQAGRAETHVNEGDKIALEKHQTASEKHRGGARIPNLLKAFYPLSIEPSTPTHTLRYIRVFIFIIIII